MRLTLQSEVAQIPEQHNTGPGVDTITTGLQQLKNIKLQNKTRENKHSQ